MEFPFLCMVVSLRGSSADCPCAQLLSVLLWLQGPGREPAQLQEELQEFEGVDDVSSGRCSSAGKGLSRLRGHKECWKWGRKKYCLSHHRGAEEELLEPP